MAKRTRTGSATRRTRRHGRLDRSNDLRLCPLAARLCSTSRAADVPAAFGMGRSCVGGRPGNGRRLHAGPPPAPMGSACSERATRVR